MNTNMQRKMEAIRLEWQEANVEDEAIANDEGFAVGFTACHDLLMPLLIEAMPHVMGSHGAEHMLDGFRPQRRPIDDLVGRLREVVAE